MRAPFSGIFERRLAEAGDYLSPGQPCWLLVELNPLVVVTQLTESQVGKISVGNDAQIALATGEMVSGTVRLVESRSNPSPRTFRTEIEVPNSDYKLKAGVTATVFLRAGEAMAQQVPSSIMTLSDTGEIGVRYVDDNDVVKFAVTETIDESENGAWVTGLPETTRIIVTGQDYVAVGTKVDATTQSATKNSAPKNTVGQ
jgi:multidrug efflux system membrane fusion protein